MQVKYTLGFKKQLKKIKKTNLIKLQNFDEFIRDFVKNPTRNSFDNKHIKHCGRYKNLWQMRVNINIRILYLKFDDYLEFRHIGKHNDIEKLVKNC